MRLTRPLLLAVVAPVLAVSLLRSDEPAFGVSCGTGLGYEPGVIAIVAGPNAPSSITVSIRSERTEASSKAQPTSIRVAAGGNSGTCTASTPSPFRVELNTRSADLVALTVQGPDTLEIRGIRDGEVRSTVTVLPQGLVDAHLSW